MFRTAAGRVITASVFSFLSSTVYPLTSGTLAAQFIRSQLAGPNETADFKILAAEMLNASKRQSFDNSLVAPLLFRNGLVLSFGDER